VKINLRAYWIFAAIVGGGWLLIGLASYWRHVPWPRVEDLRAERVHNACLIHPFGRPVVLTERYSESQLRSMAGDPLALATLIAEEGKKPSSQVSPELMKLAASPFDKSYSAGDQANELKKWSPYIQYCVRSFDRDYRAVRRHGAALEFSLRAGKILKVPLWLLLFGVGLSIVRLFTKR
jgi:hypothetical protein